MLQILPSWTVFKYPRIELIHTYNNTTKKICHKTAGSATSYNTQKKKRTHTQNDIKIPKC